MDHDEQAIRSLIATWMRATAAGDLPEVLELMDDDVVFLGPGRPPMRGKDAFAAAASAMEGKTRVDGKADIQEIRVFGDWAYCWNELTVTLHPVDGSEPTRRSGPALTVFRKKADGKWILFRDGNMTTPTSQR
jgi:uncharacterized protein (TIGR02246 family)